MLRARRRLEKREKARKEMANLERNGPGSSHGGSSNGMGSLDTVNGSTGARANYHSDTSGRTKDIVEVITLIGSDTEEEEEVRFVRKKRRGEY